MSLCLWRGDELPRNLDSAAGVVMLGGPMNVYQEERISVFEKEDLLIGEVLREEVPSWASALALSFWPRRAGA